MIKNVTLKSAASVLGWIAVGIVLGLALQFAYARLPGLFAPQPAAAAQPAVPGATTAGFECTSVEVSVYPERIHVRCSLPASGGIYFFALSTANSAHAARVLSVLETGHVTAKHLYITYDPADLSGSAIGCGNSDCRLIQFVSLLP